MTVAAVKALVNAQEALIAALDGQDAATIEQATADLQVALARVRAAGSWLETPEVRDDLIRSLKLGEAARVRTGYHADRTRRRLATLASLRRPTAVAAYGRNGLFRLMGL